MEPRNIVKLALEYAAYFKSADMQDPDELQGAEELFGYYCQGKFTDEEKEFIARIAAEEALRLRKRLETEYQSDPERCAREALEQEIAFYEGVRNCLYFGDREDSTS